MNESEFKAKWESEKGAYNSWGKYVINSISEKITSLGISPKTFFKVPPAYRLKDDESLIDKAFYRSEKQYVDPYNDIEDKVGARFVVLLLTDLKILQDAIQSNSNWLSNECRNFITEREKEPLLFTYQSVHFILRPSNEISFDDIIISKDITCEVQIRTLLQHAHAELTHDAIYKSKRRVTPKVQRTTAKSMALIEATDEFFVETTKFLNEGKLGDFNILQQLDSLYRRVSGKEPHNQKSTLILWDTYERYIDEQLIDSISHEMENIEGLSALIESRYNTNGIYRQSVLLFIYWMLKRKRRRLTEDWPISEDVLNILANDLGVGLDPA